MKTQTLKDKLKLAIFLVVGGFGLGAYLFYDFVTGERIELEKKNQAQVAELETLKSELSRVKSFAENIQNVKQEFRELNLQLESVLEYLPRTANFASLLRKMNMVADNSGVKIMGFKPGSEEKTDTFYSTARIELAIKGPFNQSLMFFDQLSRLKRIVNIESIKMTGPGNGTPGANTGALDTLVSLQTYRLAE